MDENSPVFENFLNKMRGSRPIRETRTKISADKLVGRPEPKTTKVSAQSLLGIDAKITEMTKLVISIADTLKAQEKLDFEIFKFERERIERQKRKKRENFLEKKKPFGMFTGAINRIVKPIKSLVDNIFNFFKQIFFGKVGNILIDFFSKGNRADMLKDVLMFLGKNLPTIVSTLAIVAAAMAGTLALMSLKFIPALLGGIKAIGLFNPKALALMGGLALGTTIFQNLNKKEEDVKPETKFLPRSNVFGKNNNNVDDNNMNLDLSNNNFNPENIRLDVNTDDTDGRIQFSNGGSVPGSGDADSVPSMLTPGEFVMSKGAVNKFGEDTMMAMNAMGGGTNIPTLKMGGTTIALQGGGNPMSVNLMPPNNNIIDIGPPDFSQDDSVTSETVTTANIQNSGNSVRPIKSNLNIPSSLKCLGSDPSKCAVLGATTVA